MTFITLMSRTFITLGDFTLISATELVSVLPYK